YNVADITEPITANTDCDGDGVLDVTEIGVGTDPNDSCDYNVVDITEPITSGVDCDGDGVLDSTEVAVGTDPTDPCDYNVVDITEPITATVDCDGDGVLDVTEVGSGTDPNDPCDYNVADITEPITAGIDCDGDGVLDVTEVGNGTDPSDPCDYNVSDITEPITAGVDCDGDGVLDEIEVFDGTDPFDPCSYDPNSITEPVTTTADCTAAIELTKIADTFGTDVGDIIYYTIYVENTGNVTLTDVSLVDTFMDINGNPLTLTTGPSFDSADLGSIEGTLIPGEIATYSATFIITQDAVTQGGVSNSVLGMGVGPNFDVVDDVSDDGDDFDGNTEDDPTVTDLGCLLIFNEFSPNGDGVNDTLVINCIENYPENTLEIYNRWGNIVYEKRGYFNEFDGISNGRSVLNVGEMLPVGTYYYVLDLADGQEPKVGWIYINR
ncbi:MAG: T9SS type B sorting domain-containing protein, partial [Flavobacteriaceae bacterium]|nr:T9SS type B sorting domain-containing protein [Flavobacteriaceae bacterium]